MLFNECFIENNQVQNSKLFISDAGLLDKDRTYAIERDDSPTNVIAYVLTGLLHVEIYDKTYQLNGHKSFILPHHTKYKIYADAEMPCQLLWLNVRGTLVESLMDGLFDPGQFIVSSHSIEKDYRMLTSMMPKVEDRSSGMMKGVANLLIDLSLHTLQPKGYEKNMGKVSPSLAMERYILNRLQYDFSVSEMASYFHMTTNQLNRVFKKAFQTTPYHYYQDIRLDLIKSMLTNTALSIEDIAERTGYSNRNNFSARFKALTGETPVGYRHQKALRG